MLIPHPTAIREARVLSSVFQFSKVGTSEHTSISPADIHGMWYPTVRRTLMCLSKIYRSVEKAIFQEVN